ncbi:MAG: SsrA-binding protein SmpB [Erysipelotrichaceae bacterium]
MEKIITINREASHRYFLSEKIEAGISLQGTEIKSIRKGNCNLKNSFINIFNNEAYLQEMHIAEYEQGNRFNHDTKRARKLLLHKRQIAKLAQQIKTQGYTIVPTKLYFKSGKVKMEIALAKGKDLYDKRQSLKDKQLKREMSRASKNKF